MNTEEFTALQQYLGRPPSSGEAETFAAAALVARVVERRRFQDRLHGSMFLAFLVGACLGYLVAEVVAHGPL